MKVTPVSSYTTPPFPTRAILDAHPELLRLIPRRWQGNALVLTALATACTIATLRWTSVRAAENQPAASRVAPVFQHGEGRGSFGCDAVSPPVFLSEDEARQVVVEEGRRAGITFVADSKTLPKIDVPKTVQHSAKKLETQTLPLALDGTEAKRQISYEFVSQDDFTAWEDKKNSLRSTVSTFDMLGTAKVLRDGIAAAKPEGAYAVFYDPMVSTHDVWENDRTRKSDMNAAMANAKMMSRFELRQQVRDFIGWLKAQGVI